MKLLPLFEVLQPGVNHFFDTTQFGAPSILRVIEPLIDGVEPGIDVSAQIAKARIINKDSDKYGDCWNSNRKSDLNSLIGHRSPRIRHLGVNLLYRPVHFHRLKPVPPCLMKGGTGFSLCEAFHNQ